MDNVKQVYDIAIVGGGPAGLTAGLYARRANRSVLILEKATFGGQITFSPKVENIPGFPVLSGNEFAERLVDQVLALGAEMESAEVLGMEPAEGGWLIHTDSGDFAGRTVILATGAPPKKLGVQGEEEMLGRGVHYYAACRSMMYKRKTVAVIGDGEQAAEAAMLLSRIAKRVCLVHRGIRMQLSPVYMNKLKMMGNIERYAGSRILAFLHANWVSSIRIREERDGEIWNLPCDGAFICLGGVPETGLFRGQVALDEQGYILANETTITNLTGVFAAGDVRTKLLRGILTAAADGAVAAQQAERYIVENI